MRFLKRHPVLIVFVCGLAVLGYFVVDKAMDPPATVGQQQRGNAGMVTVVRVEEAKTRIMADQVESVGTTAANQSIDITAKVAETLSRIHFQDGQFVQEGDLLVELTNAAEASRLAEAKAAADDARRQYTRLEELKRNNMVSTLDVETARTALETAEAHLEGVMVAMRDRVVRAPFTGMLGFRQVSEGSLINPGTVITTLDDISVINLDFTVPEIYFAVMQPGQRLAAHSIVYQDRDFEGTVSVVGSRVDPVTRSVQVRARIDNPDALLRPGMLLTISMPLNAHEALVVPEEAVTVNQGRQYVMIVDDENVVQQVQVSLGRRQPGIVEVLSGLVPGQRVVVEGVATVRPGQPVQILANEAS